MSKSENNIKLKVAFAGQMNCMPMQYARRFRADGHCVTYVVDVPQSSKLSRPECHYSDIPYPYPDWIKEEVVWRPELQSVLGGVNTARVLRHLEAADVVFLSGHYIQLAARLRQDVVKIGLFAGSDFGVWCDVEKVPTLAKLGPFKILEPVKRCIVRKIVASNFESLRHLDAVTYFPGGLCQDGDKVLARLKTVKPSVVHIPRFDIPFESLKGVSREAKVQSERLIIFSAVRFIYKTFPEGNKQVCKGNDLIIKGLARYVMRNPNVDIHFINKGVDVEDARQLCEDLKLKPYVTWHNEMPFRSLINLYLASDICFDQVGKNWLGAVGGHAMYLGRPLIANYRPEVFRDIWGSDVPICQADSEEEVYERLVELESIDLRRKLSRQGSAFAERYLSIESAYDRFLSLIAVRLNQPG